MRPEAVSERGSRGVEAQKEVQSVLDKLNNQVAEFDYLRLPDARAAMGRMKPMPADFEFYMPGVHGLIEAKETSHDYRIAKDKVAQLSRLHKRELAGGLCVVLVKHTKLRKWRCVQAMDLPAGYPSWDLRGWPTYDSAAEALASLGVFPSV